jgi:hypothetical protein
MATLQSHTAIQRFRHSRIRRFNDSTMQRCNERIDATMRELVPHGTACGRVPLRSHLPDAERSESPPRIPDSSLVVCPVCAKKSVRLPACCYASSSNTVGRGRGCVESGRTDVAVVKQRKNARGDRAGAAGTTYNVARGMQHRQTCGAGVRAGAAETQLGTGRHATLSQTENAPERLNLAAGVDDLYVRHALRLRLLIR